MTGIDEVNKTNIKQNLLRLVLQLKMDSEEEAYNKFIVMSDDEDGGSTSKQRKTKPEQMKLIAEFGNEHEESTIPKKQYDELWDSLADRLNSIGPPVRNAMDWRRVWTVQKYNKRKQAELPSSRKRGRISSSNSNATGEPNLTTMPIETQRQDAPSVECCSLLKLVLGKLDNILVSLDELKRLFTKST